MVMSLPECIWLRAAVDVLTILFCHGCLWAHVVKDIKISSCKGLSLNGTQLYLITFLSWFWSQFTIIIPHASTKLNGGILVSHRPSVCLSVCPSVARIVSTMYLHNTGWIIHICRCYQTTSEGVPCVEVLQNSKIWIFGKFFKFVTLILSCYDMGSDMYQ